MAPSTKMAPSKSMAELMVPVEQFTRTRDNVITSLTNLQAGLNHVQTSLNELLRTYLQHTSSILAGDDIVDSLALPPHIAANANAAIEAAQNAGNAIGQAVAAPAAPAADAGKGKKRKREKKERDPNAPKRPLTAAFLYAQVARPIVRRDLESNLGPDQKLEPNAVNLETTKRWNEMAEEDQEKWKASYRTSMDKWKEDMAAYNASIGVPAVAELHDEDEASDEAEAGALDSDALEDDEDQAAAIVSPVAKAPTPPTANSKTPRANKRQKTAQTPHANGSIVPVPIAPATSGATPVPVPTAAGSKALQSQALAPNSSIEVPSSAAAKKDKKKKAAPQPIAPAPAGNKEPSPDDPKKKAKSGRSTRNAEAEPESPAAEKEKAPAKKRDRSKRKSEGATA